MTKKLFVLLDGTELSPEEMIQHLSQRVAALETKVEAHSFTIENLLSIIAKIQNV